MAGLPLVLGQSGSPDFRPGDDSNRAPLDLRTAAPGVPVSFRYVNVTAGGSSEVFLLSAGFASAKPSFLPLRW